LLSRFVREDRCYYRLAAIHIGLSELHVGTFFTSSQRAATRR
jgi:hypothetical protein